MTRQTAIIIIAEHELRVMSLEQRESLLGSWWGIDEDDEEFHQLHEGLRHALKTQEWPENPGSPDLDPLLLVALQHKLRGVRNDYLLKRLEALGCPAEAIEGEPMELLPCPCCGYCTLDRRGEYDICPVCYWEDVGDVAPETYVGVNGSTLQDARDNFRQLGAYRERSVQSVDPEGHAKYNRVADRHADQRE